MCTVRRRVGRGVWRLEREKVVHSRLVPGYEGAADGAYIGGGTNDAVTLPEPVSHYHRRR